VNTSNTTIKQSTIPAISVVIPSYNRSVLLLKAIESVLWQTYTDYELIVIDDGSTDDTREKLLPYMECIRYYYQSNQGASAAQNAGIEVSLGEWVSILGSDDIWQPTKLERQVEVLSALGNEFGACVTNCDYIGNSGMNSTVFKEAGINTEMEYGPLENPIQYIVKENGICVQSLLVLRSLLNELGGFDESLGLSEDRDLVFRLSFKTRFCFISTPLVSIDRTPDVRRLTGLLSRKNDQSFTWLELAHKKMLSRPELTDHEIRETIQNEMIAIYYGWARERIGSLRLLIAFLIIKKIRKMGLSYSTIILSLLLSARSKLLRGIRCLIIHS
jgi:glycosyltransferase involved in cell wall biosynthesis